MTSPTAPVAPTAAERAYADIRERIISGAIPGGSLVSEGELAGELGISRTPVREAFLRLQSEGWMQLYPKRGALVREISPGEVRDVLEARLLIERWAAERLEAASDETLVALRETLDDRILAQREAIASGDPDAFTRADIAFHVEIVRAAGNALLLDTYSSLSDRQRRISAATIAADADRQRAVVEQHAGLADALGARAPGRFAERLAEHLHRTHERLLP